MRLWADYRKVPLWRGEIIKRSRCGGQTQLGKQTTRRHRLGLVIKLFYMPAVPIFFSLFHTHGSWYTVDAQ